MSYIFKKEFDKTFITYIFIRIFFYFFSVFLFQNLVSLADSYEFITNNDLTNYISSYSSVIASLIFGNIKILGYKIGSLFLTILFCINEVIILKKLKVKQHQLILFIPISTYLIYTSSATKEYLILFASFPLMNLLFDELKNKSHISFKNYSIIISVSIFLILMRPLYTLPLIIIVLLSIFKKQPKVVIPKFFLFCFAWFIAYFSLFFLLNLFGLENNIVERISSIQLYELADSRRVQHFLEFSQPLSVVKLIIYIPKYLYISIFGVFPLEMLEKPQYFIVFISNTMISMISLNLNLSLSKRIKDFSIIREDYCLFFNNIQNYNLILTGLILSITSLLASYNIGYYFRATSLHTINLIFIPFILNNILKEKTDERLKKS